MEKNIFSNRQDDAELFMQNVSLIRREAKRKKLQNMSLDKINNIINKTRKEMVKNEK